MDLARRLEVDGAITAVQENIETFDASELEFDHVLSYMLMHAIQPQERRRIISKLQRRTESGKVHLIVGLSRSDRNYRHDSAARASLLSLEEFGEWYSESQWRVLVLDELEMQGEKHVHGSGSDAFEHFPHTTVQILATKK